MLNHESIRNASFSLLPTGYSPEEVDAVLNVVAEKVASGEDIAALTSHSFELTDVGYSPDEVDQFFGQLAAQTSALAPSSGDDPAVADVHIDGKSLETSEFESPEEAPTSGEEYEEPDVEADPPPVEILALMQAPVAIRYDEASTGLLDLEILGEAVHRTADTLGSLQGFMDNEVVAMKLAVERQAQETAKRCEALLAKAAADAAALTEAANEEITRARAAADKHFEKERRDFAKELRQSRASCEEEVAHARTAADEYADAVRAAADHDRAEAQRTIENAISMQSSIAESLERARQQLTGSDQGREDIAA